MHALAALSAAAALGGSTLPGPELEPGQLSLPRQGLVGARPAGLVLRDLRGRVLGHLSGFRLVRLYGSTPRGEVAVARGGETFALGSRGLRPFALPRRDWPMSGRGCHPGPQPYVICGVPYARRRAASTVYLNGRKLVGPVGSYGGAPAFVGHWRSVERSPDGRTLLLQWSAECESPVAYFADADGSRLRPAGRDSGVESTAVGWARDGRAVIAFPKGVCGSGRSRSGTYFVHPTTGRASFVFPGFGSLWG
jgi:hypothetical protein